MANLKLDHLKKIYDGEVLAVEDFDIDIKDGEFIVLVGPSGCGKSTTLRMIAGLEEISEGHLLLDNDEITYKAAKDRDMAMVFQNYALYAHMTIYQNMAFSLMLRKEDQNVIHEKVMKASAILNLDSQLNKKPKQLSGGQRQRVAVGRAIVRNPKVFLFDEPLSNLDAKLRSSMRRELKLLHQNLKATIIYVTHDQIEALTLADRIVVMSMGKVQQIGTPLEIYSKPENKFVASFIGNPPMNFIEGTVKENGEFVCDDFSFMLDENNKEIFKKNDFFNKKIILGVRPEHILNGGDIKFTSSLLEHLGQSTLIHGSIGNKDLIFKLPGWIDEKEGTAFNISFNQELICFFNGESQDNERLR